eukprot:CAMPEP_0116921288 /NCGR_PEP_ID=MMETSP0467-20121206/21540_1 /TAXON_ID=283647 /ORGANISM="Mesodinium pulex, Strain SPMC105" /LENGTH=71 /DNA_ID=CAMNT_0004599325 /DNA_START=45 /DNA_END=260 /DNA_ORIENTATION=+
MSGLPKNSAVWRQLGLSYLHYLSASNNAVRMCLKEPLKSKALAREGMFYNKMAGPNADRVPVTSLFQGLKK